MRTPTLTAIVLASALLFGGCGVGILYTHTTEPLTTDLRATSVGTGEVQSEIKHVQLSYFGIMWGDIALGDIAKQKGLRELYYADLEYLSVLTVWRQYTLHLYGR